MDIYLLRGSLLAINGNFLDSIQDFQEALKIK
jgi:hypothetical protein